MPLPEELLDPLSLLNPLHSNQPLAYACRFALAVGNLNLGFWSSCTGLGVTLKPPVITPLGNNQFQQVLMPEITYEKVTLQRAVDSQSSPALQQWLIQEIQKWHTQTTNGAPYAGEDTVISLFDNYIVTGNPSMSWTLQHCYPTKWTGPVMSGDSKVAIESLELTHQGFLQLTV